MPDNDVEAPAFYIRYWDGDRGERDRPLPSNRLFWFCEGIKPLTQYEPNTPMTVRIYVGNCGDPAAPNRAHIRAWWADPSTGFDLDHNMTLITPVDPQGMPRDLVVRVPVGTISTVDVTFTPVTDKRHICVLARAQVEGLDETDPTNKIPLPGEDRRWAQRNLDAVKVQAGKTVVSEVNVANPFSEKAEFILIVQQSPKRDYDGLVDYLGKGMQFVNVNASAVISESPDEPEGKSVIFFSLAPREVRQFFLHSTLFDPLEPGQFGVIEIIQRAHGDGGPHTGSIGVVLLPK